MSDDIFHVSLDIDLERDGKQIGSLTVPHSRDSSAWGTLMVPIVSIRNGSGRTVLFTGASHGDEYEGPVALHKLARELEPERIEGQVIIMPALNLPALQAGTRLSPIDGMNMNRAFPGNPRGSVTAKIADFVQRRLLPLTDVAVDLHSGGKSLLFTPSIIMHHLEDGALAERTMGGLEAFGAPVGMVLRELDAVGMLDSAVEGMGKVFLSTELGGGGMLTPETVRIADRGVRNLLIHFGVMDGEIEAPAEPTRVMEVPDGGAYVFAAEQALYEPLLDLGDSAEAGEPVGRLHFIETPERPSIDCVAQSAGMLVCRRAQGWAARGDCLAVLARDYGG